MSLINQHCWGVKGLISLVIHQKGENIEDLKEAIILLHYLLYFEEKVAA